MKYLEYLIILIGIFNYAQCIYGDELLELNCFNQTQCTQFQHSDITSSCINEQCRCTTSNGESVKCKPQNPKVNNIIGGACPCNLLHAECDKSQDVCYCANKFISSNDKRRCIPEIVNLGEICEQDSQCQKVDSNAICHESKRCNCMDLFVNIEAKCASIVGNKSDSLNDTYCRKQYGTNAKYSEQHQNCICMPGHFASIDNSQCLKTAKYLENCTENLQCIGTMGPGGKCIENVCQCSAKYFVEEKKTQEGTTATVCTTVVERGQYCRYDVECYQRQLNKTEQSMHCSYGECNCKKGFYSYNEGDCTKGSGAGIKSLIELPSMIALMIFINKYYS